MKHRQINVILGAGLVLVIDQLSKFFATQAGLVQLNPGIAFSFGGAVPQVVYLISGLILLGGSWKLLKSYWFSHILIAGGFFGAAGSNLIDRVIFGGVRDWLAIPGTSISNNVADWVLSFAVVLVAFDTIAKVKNDN